jgi:hypothetical protein
MNSILHFGQCANTGRAARNYLRAGASAECVSDDERLAALTGNVSMRALDDKIGYVAVTAEASQHIRSGIQVGSRNVPP